MNKKKLEKNMAENERYKLKKCTKGITLIALVVTIVVLLILAGVTITVVFGDNGIIQLAKEAGDKTNEAVKNDISGIGELEDILHETQTGIVVEKVKDANPGKLEVDGLNGNLLTINSIEDLVVFAHNVTSGTETYADKTVKLGLSLDFNSTKSYVDANRTDYGEYGYNGELKKLLNESGFISIGTQERLTDEEISKKNFHGIFDGNNNIIYNLRIRKESTSLNLTTGMFIDNYGTIQCLGIENADIHINNKKVSSNWWDAVGILVAKNMTGSKIDKCYISGKINANIVGTCDVGGIVGSTNSGDIYNSYSDIDMTIYGEKDTVQAGLITGSCNEKSTIKNVYSKGNIYVSGYAKVGSAIAIVNDSKEIANSYTIGRIKADESYKTSLGLRTFGAYEDGEELLRCYFLEKTIEPEWNDDIGLICAHGTRKTEIEMKSEKFVNSLNEGQEGNPWKQDTNNINDGYPILSWQ